LPDLSVGLHIAANHLIWIILMGLVMGWLARSRLRPPPQTESGTVLKLPVGLLVVGLVCAGMFGAFAYFSFSAPTGGPVVASVFSAFALLGCYLIYLFATEWYEVRPDGIAYRTMLGRTRVASWEDVRHVRYASALQWFVIRMQDGRVLRLSAMLIGLPALAHMLLSKVGGERLDPDSAEVVRQTASGNLPKVWQ